MLEISCIDAGNCLESSGNPRYFAGFQQIPAGIHHIKWIMWCSINNLCLTLTLSKIIRLRMRIWLARTMEWCNRTSKTDNTHQLFLRAKPCSPCIYALDIEFCQEKSILTIISKFNTKSGPQPPKLWKRVLDYYARYPSAVWFTTVHNSWDDVPNNQIVGSIVGFECAISRCWGASKSRILTIGSQIRQIWL